jgi:flagellar basal-body rod protein FlgF
MSNSVSQIGASISELEREFGIIAHNLANVSTVGYKRRCNGFSQLLTARTEGTDAGTENKVDLVTAFDFSQGNIVGTGRTLDFALSGKGFFVIETPEGPLYTRNGAFRLDQNGRIVDSMGRIVAGESGPITIPRNIGLSRVSVSDDGSIGAGDALAGKFRLVDFKDQEDELLAVGKNCFRAPEDLRPKAAENLSVKQGFQEASNVKLVEELVDMIMVSRLYEANVQFVTAKKDASKSILDVAMS